MFDKNKGEIFKILSEAISEGVIIVNSEQEVVEVMKPQTVCLAI